MSNNVRNPPVLDENTKYDIWEKAVKIWQLVTDLKPEKQGPALVLSLKGKNQEVVLEELTVEQLGEADGVKRIVGILDRIHKKDSVDTEYEAFESFINFQRESSMEMTGFITEFERRYNKAKVHGCELSTSILGFFLLNPAKLP